MRRSKHVERVTHSKFDVIYDHQYFDQAYTKAFNKKFPSCMSCYVASVNCRKLPPTKVCERCLEHGLPCIKRDRPYTEASVATSQMRSPHVQGGPSCRRCAQRGQRCHKSHGEGLPCDKCCSDNRYCYYDAPDTRQLSNANTDITFAGEPLHCDREHVPLSKVVWPPNKGEHEDDTVVVDATRGPSRRPGRVEMQRPCRKCYYDDRRCYKPTDSMNDKCDRCKGQGIHCRDDLTGVIPYKKRKKQTEGYKRGGASVERTGSAMRGSGFRSSRNGDEAMVFHTYGGESNRVAVCNAQSDSGNDHTLDGIHPLIDALDARNEREQVTKIPPADQKLLALYERTFPPQKSFRTERTCRFPPCRKCVYDWQRCFKSSAESPTCDRCQLSNRICSTNLGGLKVYSKQKVTIDQSPSEADDEETEDSVYEEEKSNADAKPDADFTPAQPVFRNGVLSEVKRCRRCYYDGRHCYKSRGPNEGCDKCFALKARCNPDLTGIVPYDRKRAQRARGNLPLSQKSKAPIKTAQRETSKQQRPAQRPVPTHASLYTTKNRNVDIGLAADQSVINVDALSIVNEVDPLVKWQKWLPKKKIDLETPIRGRPWRRCFYEGHWCYIPDGPDRSCKSCANRNYCNQDLTGVKPWRYTEALRKRKAADREEPDARVQTSSARLREKANSLSQSLVGNQLQYPSINAVDDDADSNAAMSDSEKDRTGATSQAREEGWSSSTSEESFDSETQPSGLDLLVTYIANPPKSATTEGIQRVPCRRCLQHRLLCIKVDGLSSRCRACAQAGSRLCNPELKDVKPCLPPWRNVPEFRALSEKKAGAAIRAGPDFEVSSREVRELNDSDLLPLFDGDKDDSGYTTLRIYLRHPPKTRYREKPATVPCRRCLTQRITCIRENGPNHSCRSCLGSVGGSCSSNLKGVKPYAPRYCMLPEFDAIPDQGLEAEALTDSELDQSDDGADEFTIGRNGLIAANDIPKLFDGDLNDVGFKTLQLYMANLPTSRNLEGLHFCPTLCRRCLGQRLWCVKFNKSGSNCRSCKRFPCFHDIKDVRPDRKRYRQAPGFDPSLCGGQRKGRDTFSSAPVAGQFNEIGESEVEPVDLDADSGESVAQATTSRRYEMKVVDIESYSPSSEGYARAYGLINDERQPVVYVSDDDDSQMMDATGDLSAWFKTNNNDRSEVETTGPSA